MHVAASKGAVVTFSLYPSFPKIYAILVQNTSRSGSTWPALTPRLQRPLLFQQCNYINYEPFSKCRVETPDSDYNFVVISVYILTHR